MKQIYILLALFFLGIFNLKAQKFSEIGEGFWFRSGVETDVAFNTFMGEGADALATSLNGFGSTSGFLGIDNIHYRVDLVLATSSNSGLTLGTGLGTISKKFRFERALGSYVMPAGSVVPDGNGGLLPLNESAVVFGTAQQVFNSNLTTGFDTTQLSRFYGQWAFFGYGKSKLILTTLRIPVAVGFTIADFEEDETMFNLQVGGFLDYLVMARHKMKFREGGPSGEREKQVNRGSDDDFNNFGVNQLQFGVFAKIEFAKRFGLYGAYMLTPMFEQNRAFALGPNNTLRSLNEVHGLEFAITFQPF